MGLTHSYSVENLFGHKICCIYRSRLQCWLTELDDVLTGDDFSEGVGADIFVLAVGEGTDTITDF